MKSQDYKGYTIVLRDGSNCGFDILKECRGKFFKLSWQNFWWNNPDQPLQRAATYIDQHAGRLEERFKAAFIEFCREVHANPHGYGGTKIDVVYYLKAYKKLSNGNN